jgi:hypothetical protein
MASTSSFSFAINDYKKRKLGRVYRSARGVAVCKEMVEMRKEVIDWWCCCVRDSIYIDNLEVQSWRTDYQKQYRIRLLSMQ